MNYLLRHPGFVAYLGLQHVALVTTALVLALLFAVPLGILAARRPQLATPLFGVLGVIYTIPSLALFALLIPLLGLGFWTAVVALAAYAQMILARNTTAALLSVDPATVQAAVGMGMTQGQVLWRVQRPLAMPVFVAGVRVAVISLIGMATVAAWIDAGGLGTLVLDGIEHDYPQKAIVGALAAMLLALIAEWTLRRLESSYRRRFA